MPDIVKLAGVLLVVSVLAGFAIAITNKQTIDRIEHQNRLIEERALESIFPDGVEIIRQEPGDSLPDAYWKATRQGHVVGYAFKGSGKGYSSQIKFIAGIHPDGTILGLTILSESETPGLGTRVQEIISNRYFWHGLKREKKQDTPWFTRQFVNINVTRDITVNKTAEWHTLSDQQKNTLCSANSITAITGATITTEAVRNGIKKYAYLYLSSLKKQNENREENSLDNLQTPNTEIETND